MKAIFFGGGIQGSDRALHAIEYYKGDMRPSQLISIIERRFESDVGMHSLNCLKKKQVAQAAAVRYVGMHPK